MAEFAENKQPEAEEVKITVGENIEVSEESKQRAEALKAEGNVFLAENHFTQAVEKYTEAIAADPFNAVFFSNRAQAYIKQELYGLAIADADEAIKLDSTYVKAYYRRASGNFALCKYKVALRDFRAVCKIKPTDRGARQKMKACERAVKEAAFAAAIESERNAPASSQVHVEDIVVEASYDGPNLPEDGKVTQEFVEDMVERFRGQKLIHKKYVVQMLLACRDMFAAMPSLFDVSVTDEEKPLTVCGDTHGQYYDVLHIFELNGKPSQDKPYLFNGDFVDRGSFSFEVITTFLAYKLLYPDAMHLTRGNHETKNMNKVYGFEGEVKAKYDQTVMDLFTEVFNLLPLGAVINNKVLVVHGGLFTQDGVTLDDIRSIDRNREPPESGLMSDIMWSDPQDMPGRMPSKRGVGKSFGPDVTSAFLRDNGLDLVVRSHEVKDEGYEVVHGGQCITIFSAPNYCDQMGNKGAFITFGPDLKPKFTQFDAVPHPPVRPMAYAGMYGGMMGL
eukprot:CAMPEP_0113941658 /NCGR_PEP_ID=MMETSP1339-20121228/7534_1 /TAXON_ID=94617 /ORGANISM="Fibrocapsa japonica" /LENGTH=504 /DNA_ID=CAMNT_0000945865 /DNA_START=67 /DNA_END=1581 /DNA_ORIENTATION=+ /assembly_acc=CAM_ASM_000762